MPRQALRRCIPSTESGTSARLSSDAFSPLTDRSSASYKILASDSAALATIVALPILRAHMSGPPARVIMLGFGVSVHDGWQIGSELTCPGFRPREQLNFDRHLAARVQQFLKQHLGRANLRYTITHDGHPVDGVDGEALNFHDLLNRSREFLSFLDGYRIRNRNLENDGILDFFSLLLGVLDDHHQLLADGDEE